MIERILAGFALLSILLGSVAYTSYAVDRSEKRSCELVRLELDLYEETPADTPVRRARKDAYQREWDVNCKEEARND